MERQTTPPVTRLSAKKAAKQNTIETAPHIVTATEGNKRKFNSEGIKNRDYEKGQKRRITSKYFKDEQKNNSKTNIFNPPSVITINEAKSVLNQDLLQVNIPRGSSEIGSSSPQVDPKKPKCLNTLVAGLWSNKKTQDSVEGTLKACEKKLIATTQSTKYQSDPESWKGWMVSKYPNYFTEWENDVHPYDNINAQNTRAKQLSQYCNSSALPASNSHNKATENAYEEHLRSAERVKEKAHLMISNNNYMQSFSETLAQTGNKESLIQNEQLQNTISKDEDVIFIGEFNKQFS